jgi:hypothetical protein
MHRATLLSLPVLILGTAVGICAPAATNIDLEILDMDPPAPAVLNADDEVYVRVRYHADGPIRVWVRPFAHGEPAPAMSNGSPVYAPGDGEAFGWFGFRSVGGVDEIHVQAAPANSGYPTVDLVTPARFTWDGTVGPRHEPAAWVAGLKQKEAEAQKQAYTEYHNRPLGLSGTVALAVFALALLAAACACLLWPLWGVLRWRGIWRALAVLPLVAILVWGAKDYSDLQRDPTSHNLLPFEFLEAAVLIGPYMLIVWLLRRARRAAAG